MMRISHPSRWIVPKSMDDYRSIKDYVTWRSSIISGLVLILIWLITAQRDWMIKVSRNLPLGRAFKINLLGVDNMCS